MRPSSATAARASVTLGQRIREARERAGLSQRELAERVGRIPRSVQAWEAGTTGVTWESARALAAALDVSEDYLLTPGFDELPASRDVDVDGTGAFLVSAMRELLERMDRLEQHLGIGAPAAIDFAALDDASDATARALAADAAPAQATRADASSGRASDDRPAAARARGAGTPRSVRKRAG